MIDDIYDARPLESFFPSLAALPSVQIALRDKFGKDALAVVAKMKAGDPLSYEQLGVHDIIQDLIHENSITADSIEGWSSASNDIFQINVMQFGFVFWIEALEFEDIGFFDALEYAKDAAEFNFEPFITGALEHKV